MTNPPTIGDLILKMMKEQNKELLYMKSPPTFEELNLIKQIASTRGFAMDVEMATNVNINFVYEDSIEQLDNELSDNPSVHWIKW